MAHLALTMRFLYVAFVVFATPFRTAVTKVGRERNVDKTPEFVTKPTKTECKLSHPCTRRDALCACPDTDRDGRCDIRLGRGIMDKEYWCVVPDAQLPNKSEASSTKKIVAAETSTVGKALSRASKTNITECQLSYPCTRRDALCACRGPNDSRLDGKCDIRLGRGIMDKEYWCVLTQV
eukprot:TRINITY_DN6465_c0_g1_i1.p1 TRINITY_DN6465_c0_g1~~TRINITY_DN6465_c0_g1_i1.p1  ORF type:complete len:199 (+),score=4.85 TRINITY_DN6465_c0_g1_i1:61-597(+)